MTALRFTPWVVRDACDRVIEAFPDRWAAEDYMDGRPGLWLDWQGETE